MQKILIVAHASPHGTEKLFNTLRIAVALKEMADEPVELKLFMMSDAVYSALQGQNNADLTQMLDILIAQKVEIKLCKTCVDARGVTATMLIDGTQIGTLGDLTQWTLAADKVMHI